MGDWKRLNFEGRENICTKEWEAEVRSYLVILQCTSSWTWREMEDERVCDKKLLVARSNKGCWKIYGGMWLVLKNEKQRY